MPKRKAAVVVVPVVDSEDGDSEPTAEPEPSPPKKGRDPVKKAVDVRGRGRPPLSNEEKAKRDAVKATKSARGRGRPKGATASAKTTKSPKKK